MKKTKFLSFIFWILPTRENLNRENEKKKTMALECKNSAFSFLQYIKYPQN